MNKFAATLLAVLPLVSGESLSTGEATGSCTLLNVEGLAADGGHVHTYHCDAGADGYFTVEGDVAQFLAANGLEEESVGDSNVEVTYPSTAVSKYTLYVDGSNVSAEAVSSAGLEQGVMGPIQEYRVLAVRVEGINTGPTSRVEQSIPIMHKEIFKPDNNNVKTIFKRCSNKKAIIRNAFGPGTQKGVLQVTLPFDICDMTYNQASSEVEKSATMKAVNDSPWAKVTHKMYILPRCVNFKGAAGWGQTPGTKTWYPTQYAMMPAVQVHELGHNFGMLHSGVPGQSEYADPTGYMGNRARWDEEGTDMCFNSAKTWYFGWYDANHLELTPTQGQSTEVKLVPLWDLKVGGGNVDQPKSIVKVSDNGYALFLKFNRAKGFNRGVMNHKDMVTIVEQNGGKQRQSQLVGTLRNGQTYTKENWRDSGKPLSITVNQVFMVANEDEAGDYARVTVSFDATGGGPTPGPAPPCADFVPNGEAKWHDADGPQFDCAWYEQDANRCADYGSDYSNFGKNANAACCVCSVNDQQAALEGAESSVPNVFSPPAGQEPDDPTLVDGPCDSAASLTPTTLVSPLLMLAALVRTKLF